MPSMHKYSKAAYKRKSASKKRRKSTKSSRSKSRSKSRNSKARTSSRRRSSVTRGVPGCYSKYNRKKGRNQMAFCNLRSGRCRRTLNKARADAMALLVKEGKIPIDKLAAKNRRGKWAPLHRDSYYIKKLGKLQRKGKIPGKVCKKAQDNYVDAIKQSFLEKYNLTRRPKRSKYRKASKSRSKSRKGSKSKSRKGSKSKSRKGSKSKSRKGSKSKSRKGSKSKSRKGSKSKARRKSRQVSRKVRQSSRKVSRKVRQSSRKVRRKVRQSGRKVRRKVRQSSRKVRKASQKAGYSNVSKLLNAFRAYRMHKGQKEGYKAKYSTGYSADAQKLKYLIAKYKKMSK